MQLNRIYRRDLSQIRQLSEEEISIEFGKLREGDALAQHSIIESNLRLVVHYAMQYRNSILKNAIIELDDLISEGNIGLMNACQIYAPEKGIKFTYFAGIHIKQSILNFILTHKDIIRSPANKHRTDSKIRQTIDKLYQELQTEITQMHMLMNSDYTEEMIDHYYNVDKATELPEDMELECRDEGDQLEQMLRDREKVNALLMYLSPKQKLVIRMYFGIDCERMNQNQIAMHLKLTKQRVNQIYLKSLRQMRCQIKKG